MVVAALVGIAALIPIALLQQGWLLVVASLLLTVVLATLAYGGPLQGSIRNH
jgi:hypothetical protein